MVTEQPDDWYSQQSRQELDQLLERTQQSITALLAGVDISQLTPKERLTIGARYIALHQRSLELRRTFEQDQRANSEHFVVTTIISLMRWGS